MPTTIPYDDPSLVLGAVVDPKVLSSLDEISGYQQNIDVTQSKVNTLLMMRRSLAMTINELQEMDVNTKALETEINSLDTELSTAAADYAKSRLQNEKQILTVRQQMVSTKPNHGESPVDFGKSDILTKPLSYQSIKMDAQYFSFGSTLQDTDLQKVESFVRASTDGVGDDSSDDIAQQASAQVQSQHQNHSISGTLVITATCSHRNVSMIEPFVIDPAKAVGFWNGSVSPNEKIDTSDPAALAQSVKPNTTSQPSGSLSILSGFAYGSSFVGMVHFLKADSAKPVSEKELASLSEKLRLGGWLENTVGGFGVDTTALDEVKRKLNSNQVSAHVSLVCLGAVPTIASTNLNNTTKQLTQPDPSLINATMQQTDDGGGGFDSPDNGADQARAGNQVLAVQQAQTKAIMHSLQEVDQASNKVMGIDTLINAFDNYVQQISQGTEDVGAPIRCYIKKLSKSQIIKAWLKKNYAPTN